VSASSSRTSSISAATVILTAKLEVWKQCFINSSNYITISRINDKISTNCNFYDFYEITEIHWEDRKLLIYSTIEQKNFRYFAYNI
jgi:hypothetical protein